MRIISKYKDYYDYLVGTKYGIDNKIVLDRTSGHVYDDNYCRPYSEDEYSIISFTICDKLYQCVKTYDKKIHWNEDIVQFGEYSKFNPEIFYIKTAYNKKEIINLSPTPTELNQKTGCPILMVIGNNNYEYFPCLKNFKIAKILPPEEIFTQLTNWISKRNEPIIIDRRTDVQKIQSHGFDKKTSFRGKRKKIKRKNKK